jgi:enoyl-CoA hydratase/carnithine racemase
MTVESTDTFDTTLATDLDAALWALEDTPGVRVIVVEGAGDAFSAGIDLAEHADHDTHAEYLAWVERMERPFLTLREMGTPVVAAVDGDAAANGLGLVVSCDLAVATAESRFGATAPKVGLFCMGPAVPLLDVTTKQRAMELLLTGELVDAETAREWGLLNRVVPAGDHIETAMDLAETIAAKSPAAIQRGKQAVYTMLDEPYETALEYSNEEFARVCATDDADAGIEAFLGGEPLDADAWPGG